jgi:MFS family permease
VTAGAPDPIPPGAAPPVSPAPVSRLRPAEAAILTFLASGCILVLEIAAARLLAPYVGVSLTTYTSIIGVILAGIALGAWAGGRAADLAGPDRLLGPLLVGGGAAAIAAVPLAGLLGPALAGSGPGASLFLATAAFTLPAILLAAVAPVIVRATLRDLGTSGSVVGRLSALGTAGALVGTFLTGYVLLGFVPVRALIAGTGVLLVLLGLAVAVRLRRQPGPGTLAMAVLAGTSLALVLATGSPCDRESAYYCIAVRESPDRPTERTLVLDNLLHARVDLADPAALDFAYVQWFAAATEDLVAPPAGRAAPLEALHVGGGGFSFPRYLLARDPDSRHVVLELDPEILRTARESLGFEPDDRIEVRLGDARRTIGTVADASRGLVVGDAFASRSVPWHLTTAEFVAEVDRALRPGGRYVLNVIDGPGLAFARAEAATLAGRFEHLAVVTWDSAFAGTSGGNVVLVASHEPLDGPGIEARVAAATPEAGVLWSAEDVEGFVRGAQRLDDDFAPTDRLLGG